MVTIETRAAAEADTHRDAVLTVWESVFGPVSDPEAWRVSLWDRHRSRAGYRLVLAWEDEQLAGFGWGYTGERGQYWSDRILAEVGPRITEWGGGHFEIVELAVLPGARRSGVGGRLHDALLAGLAHERALLETSDAADDPAVRLYESRGWQHLAPLKGGRQVMVRMGRVAI
ncbi:GNAT family N-acetyltransferase [Microbacterium sp. GCS4]|uniref:GNAT family N-acetyltransferase n=1 Tax=Microbacterium sp. GCS4 TaxID=1692239 RepID=UPI000682EFDE|nr:GNAT family N-acetyltransferase [Microbacterium sp. GCS4]